MKHDAATEEQITILRHLRSELGLPPCDFPGITRDLALGSIARLKAKVAAQWREVEADVGARGLDPHHPVAPVDGPAGARLHYRDERGGAWCNQLLRLGPVEPWDEARVCGLCRSKMGRWHVHSDLRSTPKRGTRLTLREFREHLT